jgi:hypothetical protein
LEAEPAFGLVQLSRADAQIQQHTVATIQRHPLGQIRKVSWPQLKSARKGRQVPFRRFNGGAINIAPI